MSALSRFQSRVTYAPFTFYNFRQGERVIINRPRIDPPRPPAFPSRDAPIYRPPRPGPDRPFRIEIPPQRPHRPWPPQSPIHNPPVYHPRTPQEARRPFPNIADPWPRNRSPLPTFPRRPWDNQNPPAIPRQLVILKSPLKVSQSHIPAPSAEYEFQGDESEFWVIPPGVPGSAQPIHDLEPPYGVIGFIYTGSGITHVYDLEGKQVDIWEVGLERPLIDPIDVIAGGLTGLGKGAARGGLSGALWGLGRSVGGFAIRISREAFLRLRGLYRAYLFRGLLNFTRTSASRWALSGRTVPIQILKLALRFGSRGPDPQGAAGAFRYVIPMFRNGTKYQLEIVIHEATKTILHFHYY